MNRLPRNSPWVTALMAWVITVGSVGVLFFIWQRVQGQPFRWDIVRDAGLMTVPLAFVLAWRDRGRSGSGRGS